MIIDAHSHIGDILYPGGGGVIFKKGLEFPAPSVYHRSCEKALYRKTLTTRIIDKVFPMMAAMHEMRRNFAASLENFRASLDGTDITGCVCAPIAPNVTYGDIISAQAADSRIIAFTSPDFGDHDWPETLSNDLSSAAGVKIHPILQEVEADSAQVMEALEVISAFPRPVLLHSGAAVYYPMREKKARFADYSSIDKIGRLIAGFPKVKFIVGHAGLREIPQVIDLLPKYKNAYVDTSFQPPEAIKALVAAFGGGRVLFASDWPYGLRIPAIRTAQEACREDSGLRRAVFYGNAAEMLGIS